MSTTLTLDGETLTLPTAYDASWDTNLNATITAIVDKANATETRLDATDTAGVTLTGTQTLTNKTLTSPTINGAALSGTITGTPNFTGPPTVSGAAVVTTSGTQTLTNKTLTSPTINGAAMSGTVTGTPDFTGPPTVSGAAIVTTSGTQTLTNKTLTAESWTAPTLLNSWVDYGGGTFRTPGYRKLPDGTVELRGAVKSGSAGTAVIFTLPTGYRPSALVVVPAASNGRAVFLTVTASGDVAGGNSATENVDTTQLILDSMRFATT